MAAPLRYKKEFCQMLIDHMAEGLSFEAFGGVVSVSRISLHKWRESYPEFRDAFEEGYCKSLLMFEKLGRSAMIGKIANFNTAIYCFNMKNRFNWADKVENSFKSGTNVVIKYELHKDQKDAG